MNASLNQCNGNYFKVAFINTFLLNVTVNEETKEVLTETGFEAKLLNILSRAINFTYTWSATKTGFGTQLPNKSWTGIVGRLANNEMDIALSFLADTYQRRKAIDYSIPYWTETLNFYIGPQESNSERVILFTSPFEIEIWIALLCCCGLLTILLNILTPWKHGDHFSSLIYVIGVVTNQSRSVSRDRPLVTFILSACLIPLTILTIYYGDALKASTSVSNSDAIDNLDKLAYYFKSGKLKVGVFTGTFIEDFVKTSPESRSELYRRVAVPMKFNIKNIPDLNANNLAIISPGKAFKYLLKFYGNHAFKYYQIEDHLFNYNIAMGFRKRFECKSVFNKVIVSLRESGCFTRWEEEMERPFELRKMRDAPLDQTSYIQVQDLKSTFVLWLSGLIIAIIISLLTLYNYLIVR